MPRKPKTIDEYLAGVPSAQRTTLQALRKTIRSNVPDAEECISYGLAAFRVNGHVVAGFGATAKGCSYYPFSGTTLKTLAREVAAFKGTKSALHFTPAHPLPAKLVGRLLAARIRETR
jgi:uncharacterized protein YdhG (YjbR/CyaY superfamily)